MFNNFFVLEVVAVVDDEKKPKSSNKLIQFSTKLLDSYSSILEKHPYVVKIVTSGIIGGTGDILIQSYQGNPFDFRRLSVFTLVAGFYIAPVIHIWFNWLNSMPLPKNLNKVSKALAMMFVDQTVGATFITAGFFYAFELAQRIVPPYGTFAGSFIQAGTASITNNLWMTLVANWYCWPGNSTPSYNLCCNFDYL